MTKAYLEITMYVSNTNRPAAAGVYNKYKQPFLDEIRGAVSKELLIRNEDVQVLHGFETAEDASAYLKTDLFNNDVVKELSPLFNKDLKLKFIRYYKCNGTNGVSFKIQETIPYV